MKTLVVYDSLYGNTAAVAKVIGAALGNGTKVMPVGSVSSADLAAVELLIIGSPTQGGRPTPAIQDFVNYIEPADLKHLSIAAFDTRLGARYVKIFGFAANRIADGIKLHNGNLAVPAEGFIVTGKEGPLKDGEAERAASWAKKIAEAKIPTV